jgi:hypothetical protein
MTPATNADDVAALFDLPPPADPETDESARMAAEAAEAALAAEIAATIEAGGFAADAPESRRNLRVDVSWPACMQLDNGQRVELQVRNISEGGVGLTSAEPIPAYTVVTFEMDAPSLDAGGSVTPVTGRIKTTYTVARGSEILCGGIWQAAPDRLDVVTRWIERLRR